MKIIHKLKLLLDSPKVDRLIYRSGIMRRVKEFIFARNRHLISVTALPDWRNVANPWNSGRLAAWTLGWFWCSKNETMIDALKRIRFKP